MNDLIHFDAEPLSSTNEEETKFAVLNKMVNVEPSKVKYEGMCQFMKLMFSRRSYVNVSLYTFFNLIKLRVLADDRPSEEEMGSPLLKRY